MQPLSGNQRPDLRTALMNMSLAPRLPRERHLARSSAYVPRQPSFYEMLQNPHVSLTFSKVHNPLRQPRKTTYERPKVLRIRQFFDTFDFEMCFVPQRHALFRHLNFQTCSDTEVVCTFYTFVLSKMISHNMTLEIDLLWALRAAIPQGKLERGERERYTYIYI